MELRRRNRHSALGVTVGPRCGAVRRRVAAVPDGSSAPRTAGSAPALRRTTNPASPLWRSCTTARRSKCVRTARRGAATSASITLAGAVSLPLARRARRRRAGVLPWSCISSIRPRMESVPCSASLRALAAPTRRSSSCSTRSRAARARIRHREPGRRGTPPPHDAACVPVLRFVDDPAMHRGDPLDGPEVTDRDLPPPARTTARDGPRERASRTAAQPQSGHAALRRYV